jgi:hypothetical protein
LEKKNPTNWYIEETQCGRQPTTPNVERNERRSCCSAAPNNVRENESLFFFSFSTLSLSLSLSLSQLNPNRQNPTMLKSFNHNFGLRFFDFISLYVMLLNSVSFPPTISVYVGLSLV